MGEVVALLDRWAYCEPGPRPLRALAGDPPDGPYLLTAVIRSCGNPSRIQAAADVRRILLGRAEQALAALDRSGWQLSAYPAMRFSGTLKPFTLTTAGHLWRPARQERITLNMDLEVYKPEPPAGRRRS